MAAAAEAAGAALPSEGHGGIHFAIPEGTTTIEGVDPVPWGDGEDSWKEWGADKTKVTHVTIPSSVTSIGRFAFMGCSALASLAIPSSVTRIGDNAFWKCSSLASLAIPSSVTSIGRSAFNGCSSLASLAIPSSVTSIGRSAFRGCSSLASLAIPSSVTSIGRCAFYGCSLLASLAIPSSVTSIGGGAFEGCTSLASLTIPASVTSIGAEAFKNCANLASLVVFGTPANLVVDPSAFYMCSKIIAVFAPNQVVAALYQEPGNADPTPLPHKVARYRCNFKLQLETYFWSMKLHRNTSRLSARQRAWVKHLLTVGSRVRLHW
eukprot:gene11736-biopygen2364